MKRAFCILFLSASVAYGQTYDVKVDANGNILHTKLQNTATNPTGVVNYATGKLKVNGVAVTTGGGGSAPPFADAGAIIKGSVDPLKLLRFEVDRLEYTGPAAVVDLGGNFYTETAFTAGGNFSTNGNFVTIGDFFSGGVVELSNDFRTDGAFPITLRAPAEVDIFLPLTGTVATQEYGAVTWQPLDSDLTSIANFADTGMMLYQEAEGDWRGVEVGSGLDYSSGKLIALDSFYSSTAARTSAGTLDVTGLARPKIDVTGGTTITSITGLDDGEEILLRFVDGLTLTQGASLQLLGGVDTIAPANSWGRFRRDGAVVTAIDFQTEEGYASGTFDNIYMNVGGNIGHSQEVGSVFSIGRHPGITTGGYIEFNNAGEIYLIRNPGTNSLALNFDLLSGGTSKNLSLANYSGTMAVIDNGTPSGDAFVTLNSALLTTYRTFQFPNRSITFAGIDGETFTNATINGLDVSGALDLTGVITPPALDADVNDYAPAGFATTSTLRLATDGLGERHITGLAGGTAGKLILAHNVGPETIYLNSFDPSSAAANYFVNSATLYPGQSTLLQYDATLEYWVTIAAPKTESLPLAAIEGLQDALDAKLSLTGGTLTGQLIAGAGSTASNSAGIKLQSGALQTTAQAGAFEFLTDAFYLTKTTGPTRASIVLGPSAGPITFAGPTAARIITVPNAASTMARTDAAQTFTGVQAMTSPALTTPAITGLATGTGVASAATASTLVARDASASILAQAFVASGTAPTCTGATIGTGSKNNAGFVTTSTTGVTTVVVTFSTTAPTGWAIAPQNNTTANLIRQTASSTTTATFVGTTVTGDVISYLAMPY